MSIELVLYLIEILENIGNFLSVITVLLLVSFIFCIIASAIMVEIHVVEWHETTIYKIRNYLWILPFLFLISCFIPSQKTMYMMIGANVIKSSAIPSKVEQAINKKLDEYLSEDKKIK